MINDNLLLRKITVLLLIFIAHSQAATRVSQHIHNVKKNSKHILNKYLKKTPPNKQSVLAKRIIKQIKSSSTGFVLLPYKPNFILPYYYSSNINKEPPLPKGNSTYNHSEFNFQFSIFAPILTNLYRKNISIIAAYSQLSYWQFYNKSQWFRETNYEPEIMASYLINLNTLSNLGLVHQSNGRGGELERSWNRLFWSFIYSQNNWMFNIKTWLLIFKNQSSNIHNPEINKYLGHEELLYNYKFPNKSVLSIMLRNIEHFHNTTVKLNYSYPLLNHINLYLQFFHGYGQSLIDFKKRSTGLGIGINLSNWI